MDVVFQFLPTKNPRFLEKRLGLSKVMELVSAEAPGSKPCSLSFVPPGLSYQYLLFDLPRLVLALTPGFFFCGTKLNYLLLSLLLLYLFSLGRVP